ncbi:hypothetical protein ACFYUY_01490 [Kitasatospora sp. NPDC004745]|uniref:hypothetical protein n=1 Tax=Kitasatospora sp. NPDC004745 TaxID=3364019 RepID=UPI0036878E54
MAGTDNRLWDGLDPVEPGPQPSRPTPAYGAPDIGQRHLKEDSMFRNQDDPKGDHSANGGYGHQPLPPLPSPQSSK